MSDFFYFMPKKFVSAIQEQTTLEEDETSRRIKMISDHYVSGSDAYSDLDEDALLALFDEDESGKNKKDRIFGEEESSTPTFIERLMKQMYIEEDLRDLRNRLTIGDKLKSIRKRRIL